MADVVRSEYQLQLQIVEVHSVVLQLNIIILNSTQINFPVVKVTLQGLALFLSPRLRKQVISHRSQLRTQQTDKTSLTSSSFTCAVATNANANVYVASVVFHRCLIYLIPMSCGFFSSLFWDNV